MSLYNMLFGMNPLSDIYLAMVGLTRDSVGRFRDAYVEKHGDETKSEFDSSNFCGWTLSVYTRNGGGNRTHWDKDDKEGGPDCTCTGCVGTYRLPSHPLYLSDEDDDFDCTYATFHFQVPTQFWPFLEELTVASSPEATPRQRWDRLFDKLHTAKNDPEVKNAMNVMEPILAKIQEALNSQEAGSNG